MTKIYILAAVILTCQPAWAEVFPPVKYPLPTFDPNKPVWHPPAARPDDAFNRSARIGVLYNQLDALNARFKRLIPRPTQPMPPVSPLE